MSYNLLILRVPGAGFEPARALGPRDFKFKTGARLSATIGHNSKEYEELQGVMRRIIPDKNTWWPDARSRTAAPIAFWPLSRRTGNGMGLRDFCRQYALGRMGHGLELRQA